MRAGKGNEIVQGLFRNSAAAKETSASFLSNESSSPDKLPEKGQRMSISSQEAMLESKINERVSKKANTISFFGQMHSEQTVKGPMDRSSDRSYTRSSRISRLRLSPKRLEQALSKTVYKGNPEEDQFRRKIILRSKTIKSELNSSQGVRYIDSSRMSYQSGERSSFSSSFSDQRELSSACNAKPKISIFGEHRGHDELVHSSGKIRTQSAVYKLFSDQDERKDIITISRDGLESSRRLIENIQKEVKESI